VERSMSVNSIFTATRMTLILPAQKIRRQP
jgi:hypothetical protein